MCHRCYNETRTSAGWRHDPNRGCILGKSSAADMRKDLSLQGCAEQCLHWGRSPHTQSFPLIGVIGGQHCFCGTPAQLGNASARLRPLTDCATTPCSGAPTEKCGGIDRLAIHNYTYTPGVSPWGPGN
jgi:hypothetical protein